MSEAADVHEIVIIKRVQSGHEEGHHGGVWKIAFADFMTAMMAFFLVMWLISANDKTRATIARYFNPVQLVDSTPQPKGLNDPKAGSPSVTAKTRKPLAENEQKTGTASAGEAKSDPPNDEASSHDETELFKDPYAVLAELAAKNSVAPVHNQPQAPKDGTKAGSGAVGLKAGDAYRDPFAPLAFQADVPPTTDDPATARPGTAVLAGAPPQGAAPGALPPARELAEARPADAAAAGPGQGKPASGEGEAQVAALKAKLVGALKQSGGAGTAEGEPKLEVRRTNEGVLITLTDDVAFSMFASASAEPAPKMVVLMGKIGKLLKAEKGHVVVRGFTDNHPFKSDRYDNWRLSSARAHIAHYMLARGGLEDARFDRIEGYADRRPRNPKDPGGPENRRIEILLREDTP